MQPANRLNTVTEYYFSKKLREVARLQNEGKPILNLGIGSPDLPPAQEVIDVLHKASSEPAVHGYQSYSGILEFRESIAAFYRSQYNVILDANAEILPMMGSKEAIMHISMAYLNPGDRVLIPELGYPTYQSVTRLVEAEPLFYPLNTDTWEPDWLFFDEVDLSNVKLIWVNYPHMPTGARGSEKTFKKLIDLAAKNDWIIGHDNPYSFILNDQPRSILSIDGAMDVCVELNSMSKTFNMAGWRVGWICGNREVIKDVLKVKSNMDSGMFKPIQLAAANALRLPESWYQQLDSVYQERRKTGLHLMESIGASVDPDSVGMFLWGKVDESGESVSDRLLYDHDIFITPGKIFGDLGEKYVRLSLCQPAEVLEEAINRL